MKNNLLMLCLISSFLCICTLAQAEIYKSVDANGHITYSNSPSKGATRLNLDLDTPAKGGLPESKSSRARTPTPADFPKVDRQTQSQRDEVRKQILLDELDNEKKALEEAKKAYAEGESKPEVYRGANGKTFRNVAKFDEKMQHLQDDVSSHEKNVQLLQKELDSLK